MSFSLSLPPPSPPSLSSLSYLSLPPRANIRHVLGQAVIFGIAQGTIFYMYAAGFSLGAVLVVSDPSKPYHATYDELFR